MRAGFAYRPEVCSACDVSACDVCLGKCGCTHNTHVVPVSMRDLLAAVA